MTGRANGHRPPLAATPPPSRTSLLAENRQLKRELKQERRRPRHCGLCGQPVCECGLRAWQPGL